MCDKQIGGISVEFPYNPETCPCPVDYCLRLLDAVRDEMCGMGVFCRDAVKQLRKILGDITLGEGKSSDISLLGEICGTVMKLADCSLARDAAGEVLWLVSERREDFDSHIGRKRCPAVVCGRLTFVYIDPVKCTGCGDCLSACPEAAIEGGSDKANGVSLVHVISSELCTGCGECIRVCPHGAAVRMDIAGIKPRLPESPVPVGTVQNPSGDGLGKGLRKGLRKK